MTMWRGWLFPVVVIVWAEATFWVTEIESDTLAAPSRIAIEGGRALLNGSLVALTGQTLLAGAWGLAMGAVGGLVVGFLMGLSPTAQRLCNTSVEFLRPVPSVALIPLAMLIFGFGYRMESNLVAFSTFWPFLIYTQHALQQVEYRLIEVSKIMGLSRLQTVWKIFLPAILPRLFTALRLATGIALIVTVTVEIVANPQGLGFGLMIAQETLRPDRMFAMLIWVGIVGWSLNFGLLALERRLFAHRGYSDRDDIL